MRVALAQFGIRGADVLKYRIDAAEPVYDEMNARRDFFTASGDCGETVDKTVSLDGHF